MRYDIHLYRDRGRYAASAKVGSGNLTYTRNDEKSYEGAVGQLILDMPSLLGFRITWIGSRNKSAGAVEDRTVIELFESGSIFYARIMGTLLLNSSRRDYIHAIGKLAMKEMEGINLTFTGGEDEG